MTVSHRTLTNLFLSLAMAGATLSTYGFATGRPQLGGVSASSALVSLSGAAQVWARKIREDLLREEEAAKKRWDPASPGPT